MKQIERDKSKVHIWVGVVATILLLPLLAWEYSVGASLETVGSAPIFSPESGHYDFPILVVLRAAPADSTFYFTLDGSDPTENGIVYDAPIALREDGVYVLRAVWLSAENEWSQQSVATYIVGLQTSLPILSIIAEPDGLWSPESGIFANTNERGLEWERAAQLMFFEGDRSNAPQQPAFVSPAGIRIHGSASRGYPKNSLRIYFRTDYGNPRLNYPLYKGQVGGELETFDRLVLHGGGQDYAAPFPIISNWTLIRGTLAYELAGQLGVYTSQSRPALLFINGVSYGIYQIRTFSDEAYLLDRYHYEAQIFSISGDFGSSNAIFIDSNDGGTIPSNVVFEERPDNDPAARRDWLALIDFVEQNDLSNPAIYQQLEQQIDLDNFVDYAILQMYIGNTDWLRNNVKQFRPLRQAQEEPQDEPISSNQWKWILWDVDFGFGLAPWSNVEFNMLDWLYTTERPGFEEGSLLLRKLLETEQFRQRYLARMEELLEGALSAENVTQHFDQMAAEIRPDIHYETDLWTSSGSWEANVEQMRDFIQRRPQILRQHHEEWFGERAE